MLTLQEQLVGEEEGRERCVYLDSRGYMTIGIGCLVDKRFHGAGLCDAAIAVQFAHDSTQARIDAAALPGFQQCNDVRQAVLVSLCFQLGALRDWPHFRAALAVGDFAAAADAGLNSDWARTETPKRAQREMQMLRTGLWVNKAP
jgi:GH24 family phage-related lysozyme (muramidase)